MTTSLRFGSGVLAACLFTSAQAAEYSPDQFLFGDWNGSRTRLHEAGLDLQITYVNELAWNTQGGDDHTGTYSDQLMFDAALDLDKLLGWSGAGFRFTVVNRTARTSTPRLTSACCCSRKRSTAMAAPPGWCSSTTSRRC